LAFRRVRASRTLCSVLLGTTAACLSSLVALSAPASASSPTCPSSACPYSAPTLVEVGFASDVLARMNVERSQASRSYELNGVPTKLSPLPSDPTLSAQAQAFAEYLANTGELENYTGLDPSGEITTGATVGGPAYDSAGVDGSVMGSYSHALGYLSAAADFTGVGVAFDSQGRSWVVEEFGNANLSAWQAGQSRLKAELASDSVYAQSDGAVTTVTEPAYAGGGTDNAMDVFPAEPIAAASQFATGVDWTPSGPLYPLGSAPVTPLPGSVTSIASSSTGNGYLLANAAGAISIHGDASFFGSANALSLAAPIIGLRATPEGGGYWELGSDGGIFSFGDAGFYGSTGGMNLNRPVVGITPSHSGQGYWLAAGDGGVFAFGNAGFVGSLPGLGITVTNIVGMAPTISGRGYWMVGSDGGVFAFGDAGFVGSLPGLGVKVNDIVGIIPTTDDLGYWLVGRDGGVFAFGDAGFVGSLPGLGITVNDITGIATPPDNAGYWLVGSSGTVYSFGVPFYGSR